MPLKRFTASFGSYSRKKREQCARSQVLQLRNKNESNLRNSQLSLVQVAHKKSVEMQFCGGRLLDRRSENLKFEIHCRRPSLLAHAHAPPKVCICSKRMDKSE